MFKLSASILALALAATQVSAQATINSPNLVQCQPVALTWSGATGDVYLSIVQGTDTASMPLRRFPPQTGGQASGSYTWSAVDLPAGTVVTVVINDGSGQQNFSGQSTVAPGGDDCKPNLDPATVSGSAGASSAASTSAASSAPASSTTSAKESSAASSASKSSNSAASSSKSTSPANSSAATGNGNGAAELKMSSGLSLAAVVGAVGAAYALF